MGIAGSVLDDEPRARHDESQQPTTSSSHGKTNEKADLNPIVFVVSLSHWPDHPYKFPPSFNLQISPESLDLVDKDSNQAIVQFPFQNILCWGSSPQNFQFKVLDMNNPCLSGKNGGVLITLRTTQGKLIESATMSTVQKLMSDMKQRAISAREFDILLATVTDAEGRLNEDWMQVIDQFTAGGRKFIAKQGMELLRRIGPQAPFEKLDLACLIYERLLNKNSMQLVINTFEDPVERENLSHRIKALATAAAKKRTIESDNTHSTASDFGAF